MFELILTRASRSVFTSLCIILTFCLPPLAFADVVINEFMASNDTTIADPNGEFDDWVELHNTGSAAIDIGGWFMSDDLATPDKSPIPAGTGSTVIPAGGYLIMWFDGQPEQGARHVDAKLSGDGEDIVLYDGSQIVASHSYSVQTTDVSEGRIPDGNGSFVAMANPTPGEANDDTPPATDTAAVVFSEPGGVKNGPISVSLSSATSGASIFYTTDGTDPDQNSTPYTGPIAISASTPLRARAFSDGLSPSAISSQSYLLGINHDFMIIATTGDPALYYDEDTGMIPNWEEDIEVDVNLEIYETDGSQVINQMVETEIQGTASASLKQKSFAFKAKESLGDKDFSHAFFAHKNQSSYMSLVGRNSGQDNDMTMYRDAYVSSLIRDLDDVAGVITPSTIDLQGYRPAVTYINGEYYGITNLRERIDRRYIEGTYGLTRDQVDFLEGQNEVREGDMVAWNNLLGFIRNNNLSNNGNFATVAAQVDVDNYRDYVAFQVFIDNQDWPGNNNRRWRERASDSKWRWLLYDLDFSFGLYDPEGDWNSGNPSYNSLSRMMTDNTWMHPNPGWSTELFREMMTNQGFRHSFINRLADQMNVLYTPQRMEARLDDFYSIYTTGANERKQHADRWSGGWNGKIDETMASMKVFINGNGDSWPQGRRDYVIDHVIAQFPEIDGASELSFTSNPTGAGTIEINTVSLGAGNQPWTGTYFNNIPVPVTARANRGYFFSGWSGGPGPASSASANLTPNGNAVVTANFTQGSTSTAGIVINEINYNSADDSESGDWVELYNPTPQTVDISGWTFEDSSGDYFGLPANTVLPSGGYLVLVESQSEFASQFPNVSNIIGDFGQDPGGFGLSGGGEPVRLSNAAGVVIDAFEYDDKSPWPESPDGNGDSLQLLDSALDNALPNSWFGAAPTPGAENTAVVGPDQTITFAPLPDVNVLNAPITLNATASSGLAVSYSVSGPASLAGNILTLSGQTGVVAVTASQAGDANFDPAPSVVQSFNVTLAANTISVVPIAGKVATDPPFVVNATASSGLPVSLSLVSGPGTLAGNVITITGAGSIIIRATQSGNTQYAAADPIDLAISVALAENVITFASLNDKVPTDPPFSLSASASSGLAVEFSLVSGPATLSGNTVTLTGGSGTVVILAEQGGDDRYAAATAVERSFSVGLASNVISFSSLPDRLVSDGPFTLSASASSGLPVSFEIVSGPATIAGNTITLTGQTGSVTVRATQGGNTTTAAATPVEQSFNVNPAGPVAYCGASADRPWNAWISGVDLNDLSHESGKDQYGDYTSETATLNKGQDNDLTVTASLSWISEVLHYKVWIDYNRNGVFEEATEMAAYVVNPQTVYGAPTDTMRAAISVPSGVSNGPTRMRISMAWNEEPTPCGVHDSGEVNDFTVNIAGDAGPQLTLNCPADINVSVIEPATSVPVNWSNPAATTTCPSGGANVAQIAGPASGDVFQLGTTTVSYRATDNCALQKECAFDVTVTQQDVNLAFDSVPGNISVATAPGGNSAIASWSTPTASSTCPTGSVSVTQTQGPSSGSAFPVGETTISYSASDGCGNSESTSFTVTVTQTPVGPVEYCTASADRPWNAWISAVVVSDLAHTSSKDSYGDYTSEVANLAKGSNEAITITSSLSWISEVLHYKVWIDYNGNGVFEEGPETAAYVINPKTTLGAPSDIASATINVPDINITTRMRISMAWNEEPTPCGVHDSGEVNDFTVVIGEGGGPIDPPPPTASCDGDNHLFAFVGQSNMQGEGDASQAPATDPDKVLEYRVKLNSVVPLAEPAGEWWGIDGETATLGRARDGSMLSAFGNTYTNLTGKTITTIHTARGGAGWVYDTGWDHWQPGAVVTNTAFAKIDAAIARTGQDLLGIVLQGGESDIGKAFGTGFSRSEFKQGMREHLRAFHNRYNAPMYYILPGNFGLDPNPFNDPKADDVRTAMVEVFNEPEFSSHVRVVHSTAKNMRSFLQDDGVHYTQAGLNKLGNEAAAALVANQICGE